MDAGSGSATRSESTPADAPYLTAVYWVIQTIADVPSDDDWLSPAEGAVLASLRFAPRRRDWRLGRWTAKQALVRSRLIGWREGRGLGDLIVVANANGAPYSVLSGRAAPWPISISHSHGRGLCAIAPANMAIGCDLERVERRTDDFTREWFTPPEQDAIARSDPARRDELVTLLWSAKESALKAIGTGLTIATVDLTVAVDRPRPDANWNPIRVDRRGGPAPMFGWWTRDASDVITVVTAPASGRPVAASHSRPQG